jgi:hypothetical protein
LKEKRGKYNLICKIERRTSLTAILRQAQHDKEGEANAIAIRLMMKELYGCLKNLYYKTMRCWIKSGMTAQRI